MPPVRVAGAVERVIGPPRRSDIGLGVAPRPPRCTARGPRTSTPSTEKECRYGNSQSTPKLLEVETTLQHCADELVGHLCEAWPELEASVKCIDVALFVL